LGGAAGYTVVDRSQALLPADLASTLPRLRRYARVLVGGHDGADDLVATVLAAARREPVRVTADDALTWLFRRLHDALRGKEQPRLATFGNPLDICTRLLGLPLDEREVLLLVAVERFSYSDVAAVLDVPVATVMARLHRAREHFRGIDSGN
jgi:RNA polymerase sigma-70 factor, ECF subfamily